MKRTVGIGAGGHAKGIIEILNADPEIEIYGLLDPRKDLWHTQILGVPVIGNDDLLLNLKTSNAIKWVFIGIGGVKSNRPRQMIFNKVIEMGFEVVNPIHRTAWVSPSVMLGRGVTIMANSVIGVDTVIGDNVIVNTSAVVEHDCRIGNHVHIATGTKIAGNVTIDDGVHVGVGVSVIQGIYVGAGSVIGAGAVVIDNVDENVLVAGVPAKVIKRLA